ncbi:MAG: hypothetical protein AUJ75_00960 [Candidatus Omnitrophica bacterium CG1_02_49_10]|nr:MAG: hypothetical protein AUJ75_00960 [Candidatus Omnitrophica bacterium CG1_02_49_10]
MKKRKLLYISALITIIMFMASVSEAFWVWTPQTGKWLNPKYSVKDTPMLQLEWAMKYFKNGDFKRARAEFEKLVKYFSDATEAPEAQYHVGLCYEKTGNPYKAFQEYQKVVDIYPNSEYFDEVIKREYEIGDRMLTEDKRKIAGLALFSAADTAVEVFKKVAENAPYGAYGDKAQYKLAVAYTKMYEWEQARDAFEKVITDYPESDLADDAKLQLAVISFKASKNASYEKEATDEALNEYDEFLKKYPESSERDKAEGAIGELLEKKAESSYKSAQFYERIKKPRSAIIYYEDIANNYPSSQWADKARARLEILKAWKD